MFGLRDGAGVEHLERIAGAEDVVGDGHPIVGRQIIGAFEPVKFVAGGVEGDEPIRTGRAGGGDPEQAGGIERVGAGKQLLVIRHSIAVGVFPHDLVKSAGGRAGIMAHVQLAALVLAEGGDGQLAEQGTECLGIVRRVARAVAGAGVELEEAVGEIAGMKGQP